MKMVNVRISWRIDATNTGVPHDLICGCSLLDPSTEEELVMLPWWVIFDMGTGGSMSGLTLEATGDIPAGTYTAIAKAWENRSGGTKIMDITYEGEIIGAVYQAGTGVLTGELDRATQTLVISEAAVSARIDNFTISI